MRAVPPEDRFWPKVDMQGPTPETVPELGRCWLWIGTRGRGGYGAIRAYRRMIGAHRLSYEMAYGSIPPGITVDHKCFEPACVNPTHLRLLSYDDNRRNQRSACRTHCQRGHEYTPENTYKHSGGGRQCRQCTRDRVAAIRATIVLAGGAGR